MIAARMAVEGDVVVGIISGTRTRETERSDPIHSLPISTQDSNLHRLEVATKAAHRLDGCLHPALVHRHLHHQATSRMEMEALDRAMEAVNRALGILVEVTKVPQQTAAVRDMTIGALAIKARIVIEAKVGGTATVVAVTAGMVGNEPALYRYKRWISWIPYLAKVGYQYPMCLGDRLP